MLFPSVVLVFITLFMFLYSFMLYLKSNTINMEKRLESIEQMDKPWLINEKQKESVISYFMKHLGEFLTRRTSKFKRKKQERLLEKAGLLENQSFEQYMARRSMVYIGILILVGGVAYLLNQKIMTIILLQFLALALVLVIYRFYISKKMTKRKKAIIHALPYTLDLITVSVEAGLSLDGAIGRIVLSVSGPLSYEFNQTLKEMRMGIEKKEALRNMADRVGERDLSMILSSIIQADELGVSLSNILRIEGAQLREKRQQAAKEKAMKAPVKMLFPLMFFIFPTIFVIILAPAFIQMIEVL